MDMTDRGCCGARWAGRILLAAVVSLFCTLAIAQGTYPDRPIKLVIPWGAGGLSDVSMRKLAEIAQRSLGQPFVIENRVGASGTLGTMAVARGPADGYTILMAASTPIVIQPAVRTTPYDPLKDLAPIMNYAGAYNAIVVPANSRFANLEALIAAGKAQPATISYSSAGALDASSLGVMAIERATGARFVGVPFSGGATALTSLMGGHVDFGVLSNFGDYVKSGKLRLLAILDNERMPEFPAVPTLRDRGINWTFPAIMGIVAPAGVAPSVREKLEKTFVEAAKTKEFTDFLASVQMPPRVLDSAAMANDIRVEFTRYKKLVDELGIRQKD